MARTIVERFKEKYEVNEDTGCWEWTAHVNGSGYGGFWDGKRNVPAHRWSYAYANGEIGRYLEIDHLCRNRRCVNPEHLEEVTAKENMRRMCEANGRQWREGQRYDRRAKRWKPIEQGDIALERLLAGEIDADEFIESFGENVDKQGNT